MSKIEWCDITKNPVWGCLGNCPYCYARKMGKRFWKQLINREGIYCTRNFPMQTWTGDHLAGLKEFKPTFLEHLFAKFDEGIWKTKPGQRIFIGSMSDIFFWQSAWIFRVLEKVRQYPQHHFLFLTKHPEIYQIYDFPENCALGVTITCQDDDWRIVELIKATARIKFISIEPMLGKIDLIKVAPYHYPEFDPTASNPGYLDALTGMCYHPKTCIDKNIVKSDSALNWVIIGGETGHGASAVHPDWVRAVRDQCKAADVPFFFKKWGQWLPITTTAGIQESPFGYNTETGLGFMKLSKRNKAAGRLLDGVEYNELPFARRRENG